MPHDFLDAAVEALDHAVGLRLPGPDEMVLHVVLGAGLVKGVLARGLALTGSAEPVGKLLAVVGEDLADFERGLLNEVLEEAPGGVGRLRCCDLEEDPPGGPVDSHEEVFVAGFVRHLGQILDVNMDVAGRVILEGLDLGLLTPGALFVEGRLEGSEIGDTVAAQAPVKAGAGDPGIDELMDHCQQIIEGKQQRGAQLHRDQLLFRAHGGVNGLGRCWEIFNGVASLPLTHRGAVKAIFPGQSTLGELGLLDLPPNGRGRAGILVKGYRCHV